jgi:beta-glucanase (GH16 family)
MKKYLLFTFVAFALACQKEETQVAEITVEASNDISRVNNRNARASVNVTGDCNYAFSETALTSNGWTKILDEQFANLDNWNVWYGGAYNNELQLYRSNNIALSNGNLQIIAKKETVTGPTLPGSATNKTFNYTSGRLESKVLYSANSTNPKIRMVARIKLPVGYGMWPAFWSYGDPWPTQGEIDILEAKGQEPTTYYTNYFYGNTVNTNLVSGATSTINSSVSLQTCYHVYEMVWEASKLSFYLDGNLVDTKSAASPGGNYVSNLFGKSEKIVLNLAVGGNFFKSLVTRNIVPGTMEVDWLQVYRSN